MAKITDYITITELAPLLNVTRPTLYKYMMDYEVGEVRNIKYEIILIFDFISKEAKNKVDIIDFVKKTKEGEDSGLINELKEKIASDKIFKDLITLLLKIPTKYERLLVELKKGEPEYE